ncbi:uncharacterized protein LOC111387503 [Olea europaea var. sylvestris]|uniref:uncharacterized protein LOC111387503 n=1 Tax=Olea europaea var. sylvestris TaxID=158386 RepID=UPI000C1D4EB7|nr:uncharacterized protein LOC111387503 [Olea europaea var. sylvestris]
MEIVRRWVLMRDWLWDRDRLGKPRRPQAKLRSKVNGNFATKNSSMVVYLKFVLDLVPHFERFELTQVPCLENTHVDVLSKLASNKDLELLKVVPIEHLLKPSTSGGKEVLWIEGTPLWVQPIIAYLKDQSLSASKSEARKLRGRAAHFVLQEDTLYKRGFALLLLRCVGGEEATYILREIYEGICENHFGGTALAHKVLRQGYFWPILKRDACEFVILHSLVSNNGRQFDNRKMRELCDELGIKKDFSMPHHPQANGQVEAVNKIIKHTLKRKLDTSKGAWVDELALWAIRTSSRTAIGKTPFLMTYGAEAMSPVEVGVPSHRRIHFNKISNDEAQISELHLLEERRDAS